MTKTAATPAATATRIIRTVPASVADSGRVYLGGYKAAV